MSDRERPLGSACRRNHERPLETIPPLSQEGAVRQDFLALGATRPRGALAGEERTHEKTLVPMVVETEKMAELVSV